ncbi:NADAR family protein [Chitinophaga sancti]|uniref:NADAR family protein n=2 Tax=Chitinophaga sancti TaxID=1004 RepID=A0ABZ0XIH6_9BACT|nr:NADAR family protein [Chitinophaga sancti]WQD63954.1 NADAR family protein [Chitinophaga sancti]WQG90421.1 NADAR family protein [Chitinophaga sancti]
MMQRDITNFRTYIISESVVFSKTNEAFGGLSNMAPGFPLFVNDNIVSNSEMLYQAMRFSLFPDIQYEIISQNSPMTAKMISKKHLERSRQDWEQIKIKVMRWCLEVKLCQNWDKFSELLKQTGTKSIVEFSTKDQFWGASKNGYNNELIGQNALGRLLMEMREKFILQEKKLLKVSPLNITGFLLYGNEIESIYSDSVYTLEH